MFSLISVNFILLWHMVMYEQQLPYVKIKSYGFKFIWSLPWEALSAASGRATFSFSLGTSPTGMVVEAKACSKLWEAAPSWGTSTALSEEVSLRTSGSLDCSCWLGGRGSWVWASSVVAATIEAASPWLGGRFEARMAGGEIDVFWPSQLRRSLNLSSVESFLPSLNTVGTTYGRDLCPKGIPISATLMS